MSTIINTPGTKPAESSSVMYFIGIIIVMVLGGLFFIYFLPTLRAPVEPTETSTTIEVRTPPAPTAVIE